MCMVRLMRRLPARESRWRCCKSSQTQMLARCLRASGRPVTTLPDLATEPVAATLVDLLRTGNDPFLRDGDAITDTLITAAIRADFVASVLDPALTATPAAIVIEDRGHPHDGLLRDRQPPARAHADVAASG
jgi:hypothetical protein